VRFGPFEFDLDTLELRKSGRSRPLQQLPARMLRILVDCPGRVVSRQNLQHQLWADDTFVDFEVGLNAVVRRLRAALGERRAAPRYIETVARRGYRFRFADEHHARRAVTSLVVLPFTTANREAEYLSDGITELVIQGVSQLPGVQKVIARNSVYRYHADDPLEIGRRFHVQAVLAGCLHVAGDRIVLSAELLSSSDAHRIWGDRYERPTSDAPSLPAEILAGIAEAIGEPKRRRPQRPPSFPAYQLYLQGRYAWNKRPAVGAVDKAIALFEESIRRDPESSLANVGLADSYNTLAAWESGSVAPRVGFEKAKEAARRALRVDPGSAEAHASLAYANLHYDWNLAAAERAFKRSLRLNSNYSHAHHWYAHLLIAAGRIDEALLESRRILELDPLDLIINVHLAWHYYMAGKALEALNEARRVLDMERSFHWGWFFAGLALGELGEHRHAVKELERAVELSGRSTVMLSALGYARAAAGNRDDAIQILDELAGLARSRYVSAFEVALIHVALGEMDAAFEWLDRAYEERSGWLPYVGAEPRLAPLRQDARFARLLDRIGLNRNHADLPPYERYSGRE
jgi:TolB-like protein/tetratricopeptide (TPR) repeat protein